MLEIRDLEQNVHLAFKVADRAYVMETGKTLVYRRYALVTAESAGLGIAMGAVMVVGAYLGRRILDRLSDRAFVVVVEVLITGLGVLFLVLPPR